jgi:lysozyme family protein
MGEEDMSARFERFMPVVFKHEGGYVNDPDDLGGETNYGITKRRYPEMDIKNLTKDEAKKIYYRDFYLKMGLTHIGDDLLALHVMDMGINAGKKTAISLLQQLLKGCKVDGILGPSTGEHLLHALQTTDMVAAYKAKRIERYYEVSTYRRNAKFLKGWIRRVNNTKLT